MIQYLYLCVFIYVEVFIVIAKSMNPFEEQFSLLPTKIVFLTGGCRLRGRARWILQGQDKRKLIGHACVWTTVDGRTKPIALRSAPPRPPLTQNDPLDGPPTRAASRLLVRAGQSLASVPSRVRLDPPHRVAIQENLPLQTRGASWRPLRASPIGTYVAAGVGPKCGARNSDRFGVKIRERLGGMGPAVGVAGDPVCCWILGIIL